MSISDERLLFAFSTGGIILGPGLNDISRIEGGARTEVTTEILGCRADGEVVVCDGYVNADNAWSGDETRVASPPFGQGESPRTLSPGFLWVTQNGMELSVSADCRCLEVRRPDSSPFQWQAPENAKITDADATKSDEIVATVCTGRPRPASWLYQINKDGATPARPIRLNHRDTQPRIVCTVGDLAVIEWRDNWGHDVGPRVIADLRKGATFTTLFTRAA